MEFVGGRTIGIDKEPNELDKFVIGFLRVLFSDARGQQKTLIFS